MIGYLLGIGAALLLLKKKKSSKDESNIGAIQKAKRRVFAEVSMAQKKGIDFELQANDLDNVEIYELEELGKSVGWKQSKRSAEKGVPYGKAYFNSLRRAYKQVSGISGTGYTDYKIKDANGRLVLTQRLYDPILKHVEAEEPFTVKVQDPVIEEAVEPLIQQEPSETAIPITKQEQILQDNPHLKVHDAEKGRERIPIFNYLILKSRKDTLNNKWDYRNMPIMAFINKDSADKAFYHLNKTVRDWNKTKQDPNGHTSVKLVTAAEFDPKKSIMGIRYA